MSFRVLHVDDDPLMRDVVELSFELDPAFMVASCASGDEALAIVAEWTPDLILCDVMMPDMDGPAVLAHLRQSKSMADIPVVFMTARSQASETARLISLGAVAVIDKPFDPQTLAETVRRHLHASKFASGSNELPGRLHAATVRSPAQPIKLAAAGYDFAERLRADAARLATFRTQLRDDAEVTDVPEGMLTCVHKLAGAAGVFNFQAVSAAASALEETIIERCAGQGAPGMVDAKLDALLASIARE